MTFNDVGLSDDGFEFNGSSITGNILNGVDKNNSFSFEITFNSKNCNEKETLLNYTTNSSDIFGISIRDNNNIAFGIWFGSSYQFNTSFVAIPRTTYHCIAVYNTNSLLLYVNGIQVTGRFHPSLDTNIGFTIGGFNSGSLDRFFNGTIKHVSIYNRALTAQEVADRYNEVTFQFLNDTPTPTQQNYIDFWDTRKIGRQ